MLLGPSAGLTMLRSLRCRFGVALLLAFALGFVLGCGGGQSGDRGPRFGASVLVTAPDGSRLQVTKTTYLEGGQVVAVIGEVIEGRDGSLSIRDTYDMRYEGPAPEAQPSAYTTVTVDVTSGEISLSTWQAGEYWTEDDVQADAGAERGYSEERTTYYAPADRPLFPLAVTQGERPWSIVDLSAWSRGVTTTIERSEMRYYREEDELADATHIRDQLASYHEERADSSAPDLATEADWYGATYGWAFKDKDDQDLAFSVWSSTEYIEGFVRTPTEVDERRSVSLITGFSEDGADSLGHAEARAWRTEIGSYERFGRLVGYSEEGQSDEGDHSFERSSIEYYGDHVVSFHEKGTDAAGDEYRYERSDIAYNAKGQMTSFEESGTSNGGAYTKKRSNITYNDGGQMQGFEEVGIASGVVSTRERSSMLYDSYGRLAYFEEVALNEPGTFSEIDHYSEQLITRHDDLQRPVEIWTYLYRLSGDGTRNYYEGTTEFREYDMSGNVGESRILSFSMTLTDPAGDPNDVEEYSESYEKLSTTTTRTSDYDHNGNPRRVDVEEYEYVGSGVVEFTWTGGRMTANHEFDSQGNPTASETYHFVAGTDGERHCAAGEKVTRTFDDGETSRTMRTWMRIEGEPDDDCGSLPDTAGAPSETATSQGPALADLEALLGRWWTHYLCLVEREERGGRGQTQSSGVGAS